MSRLRSIIIQFIKQYQLPIFSGVLIGTSYIPFPPWAALFGFVPLWLFWSRQTTLWPILIGGWITQFLLTSIGFSWIAYNIHEFGALPWVVAILGMIIFCSFANIYIPIAGGLWWLLSKTFTIGRWARLILIGLITSLCEMYLQTIFHWNFAYTWMWVDFPIYQLAEFVGFSGLSSLIIIANSILLIAWLRKKEKIGKIYFASIFILFFFLNFLGLSRARHLPPPNAVMRPLIVQGNISNQQKIYAEQGWGFRQYISQKFLSLTQQHLTDEQYPDFALWPETAFPDYLNVTSQATVRALKAFLKNNNLPLITGGYTLHPQQKSSNSLYFINPEADHFKQRYDKSILLAFGEYIPGSTTFPILKRWLPMVADFYRGPGPSVIDFLNIKIGAQICYESLYPGFSQKLSELGAEVILNVTNDSWFGWWQEPYQHLIMTLARGIEFRRPIVRATNTGISTVMLANGQILEKSPIDKEWAHTYLVPFIKNPRPTFYQRFFYLVPILLAISILFILGLSFGRRKESIKK